MAKPSKKTTAKKSSATKVTRLKAADTKPAAINQKPTERIASKPETKREKNTKVENPNPKNKSAIKKTLTPFTALGRYFKGAWFELKQVRWPTRRATWGLTAAVVLYSLFFVALIVLLDAGFNNLFELIIG